MPLEVQDHTLPHWTNFKHGKYETRGLSCGSTISIYQDVLKSVNLLHKQGFVDSLMHTIVDYWYHWFQAWGGPGSTRGRQKSNWMSSGQSVVLKYNCYYGESIWTGLKGSVPMFSLRFRLPLRLCYKPLPLLQRKAKFLKTRIPIFLPLGKCLFKQTNDVISILFHYH